MRLFVFFNKRRKDHEGNEKVPNGYVAKTKSGSPGVSYNQTCVIAQPNESECGDDGLPNITTEENFSNFIVKTLCDGTDKTPEENYVPWSPKHSLTKVDNYPSLDKVLVDESVHDIISNYFLEEDEVDDNEKIYSILKSKGEHFLAGFYTRRESDNRYSEYAVEKLGYPDDTE